MTVLQRTFLAAVIAAVLTACWSAATWRAELHAAEALGELRDRLDQVGEQKQKLELAIAEQNQAVAVAQAKTQAAEAATAQAQLHAASVAVISQSRLARLDALVKTATTCDQVLDEYWEMRR